MPALRKPFQLLLLCFVVFSVYYTTIYAEFCLLDDRETMIGLSKIEHMDLKSIFFPNSANGGYYRPLIGVSYMLDRFVWDLDPRILHFENIFFHLINAVLLFMTASELLKNVEDRKSSYLPLVTALLFAVHPIATESVNWISGRTDLLAGIFLLLATYILIKYQKRCFWWYWPAIGICVLIAMFAKETAIAFIFVALIMFRTRAYSSVRKVDEEQAEVWKSIASLTTLFYAAAVLVALYFYNYYVVLSIVAVYGVALSFRNIGISKRDYLNTLIGITVSVVLALVLFFLVRKFVFVSDVARIPQTLTLFKSDVMYAFKVFTGATGFYVKKFMFPYPLNFAIREIDPLYELLGIGVLLTAVLFLRLGGVVSALSLSGLFMVAPALPLSLGTVAWTAYAERYVYLATPFWLLAAAITCKRILDGRNKSIHLVLVFTVVAFLVVWAGGTYERNLTWETNLRLFEDTVQKAPFFKMPHGLYMQALYENNRYDEAMQQYWISSSLPSIEYDEKYDMLYALIRIRQGYLDDARSTFENVLKKKETVSVLDNFLKLLVAMREGLATGDLRRYEIDNLVLRIYGRLYMKSGDALYLYRQGQEYLNNSKRTEAKLCFLRAAKELPESSEFKKYAKNLALQL